MEGNSAFQARLQHYQSRLSGKFAPETLQIIRQIRRREYKAMIVYPAAEREDAAAIRYECLLRCFAEQGYLAIRCKPSADFAFEPIAENLYRLSHDEYLLPLLRSRAVIVLCSHPSQLAWAACLPHKWQWADFAENQASAGTGDEPGLAETADMITASSPRLRGRIGGEAYLLPDGREAMASGIKALEAKIRTNPKAWTIFANLRQDGEVCVMTKTFLNFDGAYFFNGGAERYLLDLAELVHRSGHGFTVHQYGDFAWVRRLKQIDIVSLYTQDLPPLKHALHATKEFSQRFYEQAEQRSSLAIYSPFYEAWPTGTAPNIGISHGVDWDNPYADYKSAAEFWIMNQLYIEGAANCEELVSVDTNTANWFQTVNYEQGRRIKVIPNYVDLEKFQPAADKPQTGRTVILYPRQLYSARGLYLVLDVIDEILLQFPQVDFHFVGRGGEQDIKHLAEKMAQWKERIRWDSLSLDEMPKAYQGADIALIPTVHSEGTSLSCLEAMASGNAVIATRIGGLTDLVIHNYNGCLIEPHAEALQEAISFLLQNPERLKQFQQRAIEVAQAFSKQNWLHKWSAILDAKIDRQQAGAPSSGRLVEFRLDRMPDDIRLLGAKVVPYLQRGDLVYIRVKDQPANRSVSFGRMQWVGWDEPEYGEPDEIIEYGKPDKIGKYGKSGAIGEYPGHSGKDDHQDHHGHHEGAVVHEKRE